MRQPVEPLARPHTWSSAAHQCGSFQAAATLPTGAQLQPGSLTSHWTCCCRCLPQHLSQATPSVALQAGSGAAWQLRSRTMAVLAAAWTRSRVSSLRWQHSTGGPAALVLRHRQAGARPVRAAAGATAGQQRVCLQQAAMEEPAGCVTQPRPSHAAAAALLCRAQLHRLQQAASSGSVQHQPAMLLLLQQTMQPRQPARPAPCSAGRLAHPWQQHRRHSVLLQLLRQAVPASTTLCRTTCAPCSAHPPPAPQHAAWPAQRPLPPAA
jgi:hypothetical protein